jgi:3-oxoacyl-[acyl-carrier-protein] synthase-3
MYSNLLIQGGAKMGAQVKGTGYAFPSAVLSNKDLEQMVKTSNQWIIERTGIRERRIADQYSSTSAFCIEAALMALKNSGLKAEQLDLIIVSTSTPDMFFPSTACLVQAHLQAFNAAAFDLEAGCTGFVYGLSVAEKFLLSPAYKNILLIGADLLSKIVDYTDRNTCVLFGDGAGAVVFGSTDGDNRILGSCLGADGRGADLLYMPAGGTAQPSSMKTVQEKLHSIKMNGPSVFRFASKVIVETANKLLQMTSLTYQDIDLFVPHQANLRIIQTAMKHMSIPVEKTVINIDKFGNTSAASIPVALSLAEEEGRLNSGDLVLTIAFGAGLTYGGALIRWGSD